MLVMQANGMVSHSAPGKAEPVRPVAPLCIPVVGKVQLSSRLQQLLQRSNELDRLQALQQQAAARAGGGGDHPPADALRRVPVSAAAAVARSLAVGAVPRPTNGHLKELQPSPRPSAATPPHVVSAVGDGFAFKAACHDPTRALSPAVTSSSHQKILPKPVPLNVAAEPPVSYKLEKVRSRHKTAKAREKLRLDAASVRAKSRAASKATPTEPRAAKHSSAAEVRGARARAKSSAAAAMAAAAAAKRLPSLPAELRAYQFASQQELAARRPLLPPPAGCSELESSDSEPAAEDGVPAAARRYRERRRFSRCCRLLVEELRRSGGPAAARLCARLLRPAPGAADTERGRRLRARQRLEARRLLSALQEARDRRQLLGERARLAPLLADAAAAYPSRTGQLLLLPEQRDVRPATAHDSSAPVGGGSSGGGGSRTAQLVRRPCCHRGPGGACQLTALPCTRHCARHILYNVDQLLFQHCTAKFSDNTQCCAPVFDIKHELPLCEEHARKRDNYEKMAGKTRSEPKKKSRSIKRPKRRKKTKKKTAPRESTPTDLNRQESFEDGSFGDMDADLLDEDEEEEEEEEEDDDLEEDDEDCVEAAGTSGGSGAAGGGELDRSLELHLGTVLENEFSEVLSKLPDEAFTELFADPHAGDLVHKETEELERALEAVERESDGQAGAGGTVKSEPAPVTPAGAGVGSGAGAGTVSRHHVLNGNPSLGGSAEMEESVYSQLAQGISLENAISNVLNGQEMNTLNQLLTHLGDTVIQDGDSATISAS